MERDFFKSFIISLFIFIGCILPMFIVGGILGCY